MTSPNFRELSVWQGAVIAEINQMQPLRKNRPRVIKAPAKDTPAKYLL